jgi:hypothetical protein
VSTALDATTSYTNWSKKIANATITSGTTDTTTNLVDGTITASNSKFVNMDGSKAYPASIKTASYYVALMPRAGASVIDQGVYTVRFTYQDTDGNNIRSTDLKIDFVSTKNTAGALLSLTAAGTFVAGAALATTGAAGTASLKMTLKNRDSGRIVSHIGWQETPTIKVFDSLAVETMTGTLLISDSGSAGIDFGNTTDLNLIPNDGVYGVRMAAIPAADTVEFKATYGNATAATAAVTTYTATTGYAASAVVTATGSVATLTTLTPYTLPLTTKSAVVTVTVVNSSSVAVQDYPVRFSTAWTNCSAGDATPVSGSTGATTVMTNSSGKASLTITCGVPADAASATVSYQYGATAGTDQVINWVKSKPSSVSVDPVGPMTVALKSVNKATFTVLDAFGKPVAGEVVNLTVTGSNNTTASPLLIPSATTDANGQVSYTLTDALAIAAGTDAIKATTTTVAKSATLTLTYATTVPVAATMKTYYDALEATWTTLVPVTTIYRTGSTGFSLNQGKDITKSLAPATKTATDDVIGFNAYLETAAVAAASGVAVTVSISDGGWILSSAGLPTTSRTFYTASTGYTGLINVTATTPGTKTVTFKSGSVTSSAKIEFTNGTDGSTGRFVTVTAGSKNAGAVANGDSYPTFTAKVTDALGNAVAGAALNIVATGVGRLTTGGKTAQWTTGSDGSYTFELASTEAGTATVTVTETTAATNSHADLAGYIGTTAVDNTALAAGNDSATGSVTFAEGSSSATTAASAAADAAAEATDAANAATDAANAAAEAADAATAAAQDAADAVAALSAQVSSMMSSLKAQLTALTNLVIKIQKKVKA